MVIRALDIVPHCNTATDGTAVYEVLASRLSNGQATVFSFEHVDDVPSSFVNASIVKLFEKFELGFLRTHLRLVGANAQIADIVRRCFANAQKRKDETLN